MKRAFLMAVLAAVCGVACAEEDTNLYYKVFTCRYHDGCRLTETDRNRDVKEYLSEQYHVIWPVGSEAVYMEEDQQVVVRNTQSNLNVIVAALAPILAGRQIAFEFQVFAFSTKDVERLLNGQGVSCDSLMELRKKGRARMVTTARSITHPGQEAMVKDVREIQYPTEIECEVGTNQAAGAWVAVPANFEMREVGTILQVVPDFLTCESGPLIQVVISPQWVSFDRWETFDASSGSKGDVTKVPFRQPIVNVSSIQTTLTVEDGETVLLGGGKAIDGDWVHYHFFKAWAVWPKKPK